MRVAGAVDYFREHLGIGDYLSEGNRVRMTWFGRGAEMLGLSGGCDLAHFENLCGGKHPVTGLKLTVRDKGAHRRVCFFAQISAPKDVSIAYLVGGDRRIGQWWEESVREALREIEAATATRVRRGGVNEDRTTGNMIAAVVTHDASRALDPQLHTHLCIINLTYDAAEERWKGVQATGIYRHQGFFREACHQSLAAKMQAAGYELTDIRGNGFNIQGFPAELREKFSKRRREILAKAAEVGATSQAALRVIAASTRADKVTVAPEELRAKWREEAGAALETIHGVIAATTGVRRAAKGLAAPEALLAAEAHIFERRSVVDARDLLREGLRAGRGDASLSDLRQELERRIGAEVLIRIGEDVASSDALAAEQEFVAWAHANRTACQRLGSLPDLSGLGDDQQAAVKEVLGSTSRVVVLQGDAGTGKTTCLRTIVNGITEAGGSVFGCAPSAGATDVLRKELTSAAETLQQWLVSDRLRDATRGHVVLVDEAGLVSVPQMRDMFRLAAAFDNRLLLVGDIKQHTSVEAGDALRCLQKYSGVPVARLEQIRRQKNLAYRDAVAALARGDAFDAFKRFERLGAVREIENQIALFRTAARDYVTTVASGKKCLAISPVWEEIFAFTDEVRGQLRAVGVLKETEQAFQVVSPLHWTKEERRRVHNYQPGDALVFHRAAGGFLRNEMAVVLGIEDRYLKLKDDRDRPRWIDPRKVTGFEVGLLRSLNIAVGERLLIRANAKAYGLTNGDIVEVVAFGDGGVIRLTDGRKIPRTFREYSHGYATTSHSAQGKTVDRGILLIGEAGLVAADLKQAYVSNSRFRETQMIYTTDRAAACDAMQRPGERRLATEAVEAAPGFDTSEHAAVWQRYFAPNRPGVSHTSGGFR